MASQRHNIISVTPQTPAGIAVNTASPRRFFMPDACRSAADVHARAAVVRAWRDRLFRQPAATPPQATPAPAPVAPPALPPIAADNDNAAGIEMPGRVTVRSVVEVTAQHFGTTAAGLLTERRTQPLCRRRQIAMFIARQMTGRSLPFIARMMGKKDHTTILHACRAVQALIDAGDAETVEAVNAIVANVMGVANV